MFDLLMTQIYSEIMAEFLEAFELVRLAAEVVLIRGKE